MRSRTTHLDAEHDEHPHHKLQLVDPLAVAIQRKDLLLIERPSEKGQPLQLRFSNGSQVLDVRDESREPRDGDEDVERGKQPRGLCVDSDVTVANGGGRDDAVVECISVVCHRAFRNRSEDGGADQLNDDTENGNGH